MEQHSRQDSAGKPLQLGVDHRREIPSSKKPDHRKYNKSLFTLTSQKPGAIIAGILDKLGLCTTVIGDKLEPTLASFHGGGMRGYMDDVHHGLGLQLYRAVLIRRENLRQCHSSSTTIFAWPKVNPVYNNISGNNSVNLNYCSLGNRLYLE
ncbi:hypothetical protein BTVI_02748 [Pitangus sulphuratus]|nr:hypothetical protein BTVI_02748 [Pitangus sulphuratus]